MMAGITKFAATLSRITLAAMMFTAMSTASLSTANAAPLNGMGEEDYVLLFGPKFYRSPLTGKRTTTEQLSIAPAPQAAQLFIVNGTGDDLRPTNCSPLPLVQRLLCLASNVSKAVRVALERPKQIEIALNGQLLVTEQTLPPLTNTLLVPITLQSSNSLKITLKGSPLSFITVSVRGIDHSPPEILLVSPQEGQTIQGLTVEIEGQSNERLSSVTAWLQGEAVFPMTLSNDGRNFEGEITSGSPGPKVLTLVARDPAGNETTLQRQIRLDFNRPPEARLTLASNGTGIAPLVVLFDASQSSDPDGDSLQYRFDFDDGTVRSGLENKTSHEFSSPGNYDVEVRVTDPSGRTSTASVTVQVTSPILPPDPIEIAPPLSQDAPQHFHETIEFLYSGSNPIQKDVQLSAIREDLVATLSGQVLNQDGTPLSGVKVTSLGKTELGYTISREDGKFDIAFNSGGLTTLKFERNGYATASRDIETRLQTMYGMEPVRLVKRDTKVTTLQTGSDVAQVATGSPVSDERGTRTATVLIPPNTTAHLQMPGGGTLPVENLNVRMTEFTVGPDGPKRMPAKLPTNVAYTYALEVTADEAIALGAEQVVFSQPVPFYVDNFLSLPAGIAMPLGYLNPKSGHWEAENDGIVVRVLSQDAGKAVLDLGDGQAASAAKLSHHQIQDSELEKIAELYQPGQSFWRMRLKHLSTYDANGNGTDVDDNNSSDDANTNDNKEPCPTGGCIIDVVSGNVSETINLPGVGATLNYSSRRGGTRAENSTFSLQVLKEELPEPDVVIEANWEVAGRKFSSTVPHEPNAKVEFTWDGKDQFGRQLFSEQFVRITIKYSQPVPYAFLPYSEERISTWADPTIPTGVAPYQGATTTSTREEYRIARIRPPLDLATKWAVKSIGKWTFNMHHFLDIGSNALYKGDGNVAFFSSRPKVVRHIAGNGSPGFSGDGGLATQAQFNFPRNLTLDNEGNILIADILNRRIRKIDKRTGIITTIAGNGSATHSGDGGPALSAGMVTPVDLTVDRDGNIYLSDYDSHRVRKIDNRTGIITTVIGTGTPGYSGDGGLATHAQIRGPRSVIANPDGSLFVSEESNHVIRRVDPNGIIRTFAGTGNQGNSGDGGPAIEAQFSFPNYTARDTQGNLYVAQSGPYCSIRRISPAGIVSTIVGTGSCGDGLAGEPANLVPIGSVAAVAVSQDGKIYIADRTYHKIRTVDALGNLLNLIGTGDLTFNGLNRVGAATNLAEPTDIEVRPDGSLVFIERLRHVIREYVPAPAVVRNDNGTIELGSEDSSEIWVFDPTGRHLRTLYGETRAVKYEFEYNDDRLTAIVDGDSNRISIARNDSGAPSAITSPYGQVFTLNIDGRDTSERLSQITYPTGERYQVQYDSFGMMTKFIKPRGGEYTFAYDQKNRLIGETDPEGGSQILTRTSHSTAEGKITHIGYLQTFGGSSFLVSRFGDETARSYKLESGLDATLDSSYLLTNTISTPDPRLLGLSSYVAFHERFMAAQSWNVRVENTKTYSGTQSSFVRTDLTQTDYGFSQSVYDSSARAYTSTTSEGRFSQLTIDEKTRPIREQIGTLNPTEWAYDARGRLIETRQGIRSTKYRYDSFGFLLETENTLGQITRHQNDATGKLLVSTTASEFATSYEYDSDHNLEKIILPGNIVHSFASNLLNNLVDYLTPLGNRESKQYTRDRELSLVTRADGKQIQYQYQQNAKRYLASISTPSQIVGYTYVDGQPLIQNLTTSDGSLIFYQYSHTFPLTKNYYGPFTAETSYEYDQQGRLLNLMTVMGSAVGVFYNSDRELFGVGDLRVQREQQTGLISGKTLGPVAESFTYNNYGEVTGRSINFGIGSEAYTRDDLGRIVERSTTIGGISETSSFAYDPDGRLIRVVRNGPFSADTRYTYDDRGNRIAANFNGTIISSSYDNEDRLTASGDLRFSYNAQGELQEKENIVSGQKLSLTYNEQFQLTRVVLPDSSVINYGIDGEGKRLTRSLNGARTHGYVYDHRGRLIGEISPEGALRSHFIYVSQDHSPDYMIHNGVRFFFAKDHLGSVKVVLNIENGTYAQILHYDEFGRVLSDSNPGFQPFGFAGGHYDHQTGLTRFGARDYDPEVGRWLSKDPILFAGGKNLYVYAENDPINKFDPSGLLVPHDGGPGYHPHPGGGGGAGAIPLIGGGVACPVPIPLYPIDTAPDEKKPNPQPKKNRCPEGYEAAKQYCYNTTKPNSEERYSCFADAHDRCVLGK